MDLTKSEIEISVTKQFLASFAAWREIMQLMFWFLAGKTRRARKRHR
jgi:hypothetical protein